MKTVLIYAGSSKVSIEKIRELLSKNSYMTNTIKNRVFCIGAPNILYDIQEFLGFDEFTFWTLDDENPLEINEHIDEVIIIRD